MPLEFEVKEDPNPEVTAFAKAVVKKGQQYALDGVWCDTYKMALRDMGLDPESVFGTKSVTVSLLLPVEITMKIDPDEYRGLSTDDQHAVAVKALEAELSIADGAESNCRMALYRAGDDGKPNLDHWSESRFVGIGSPVVFDMNEPLVEVDRGLVYVSEGRSRFAVALSTQRGEGFRHMLSGVEQTRVADTDWSSFCGIYTREWASPPEEGDQDPWCPECLRQFSHIVRPATPEELAAAETVQTRLEEAKRASQERLKGLLKAVNA